MQCQGRRAVWTHWPRMDSPQRSFRAMSRTRCHTARTRPPLSWSHRTGSCSILQDLRNHSGRSLPVHMRKLSMVAKVVLAVVTGTPSPNGNAGTHASSTHDSTIFCVWLLGPLGRGKSKEVTCERLSPARSGSGTSLPPYPLSHGSP